MKFRSLNLGNGGERMGYKRVLLKITGEALKGESHIFDRKRLDFLADEIKSIHGKVKLAVVIGGGNIVRGSYLTENFGTESATADHIGMTATILNALLLQDFLERGGVPTRVMSSIEINKIAEPYIIRRAKRHLEKSRVIVLAAGTGNPGVTTDTAAVLRASDIGADVVMKGTKVDGVYASDPMRNPGAKHYSRISYNEFLRRGLSGILDRTAVAQAEMKRMPIFIFKIFEPGNLLKAINGQAAGTLIS